MTKKIWQCKIGEVDPHKLTSGADAPMRNAVESKYFELTGEYPEFNFSGWGAELTELERSIVDGAVDHGAAQRDLARQHGPELFAALEHVEQFVNEISENELWWKVSSQTDVSTMLSIVKGALSKCR